VLRVVGGDLPRSGDELRRQLHLDPLSLVESESTRPDLSACMGHAFVVRERGRDRATATLWIDRFEGKPQERSQTVPMTVSPVSTEVYWDFAID